MEASATIVNVNSTQTENLIGFLGIIVGATIAVPEDVAAFTSIMVEHGDALIAGADDQDVEGCFMVLFKDIQLCADEKVATELVKKVTGVVAGKTGDADKPHLRLRIMTNL